ncbi:hypothetical protein QBC41DRAFT_238009 [Cercophora samala]|uniref:Uncharacterized protein n=1 Tax=Cercophora samala TaxID=330535 RepID=A0AA39YUB9_9PEZI|nr:hypothetical protein QBC41DRAFT_238009 [Cercophora samala]
MSTPPPHGTKRPRENDDDDDDVDDNQRPTKITIGDNENYPVLWSDYSQLPRLCWSLRDRRTSLPAPTMRNITIARVHHTTRSRHSVAHPPPETRYLRDLLQPSSSLHQTTPPRPPNPRRVRSHDNNHHHPLPRPLRTTPTIHALLQEQHLLTHRIHLPSPQNPAPSNLAQILLHLKTPIPSLEPSSFPVEAFHNFVRRHGEPTADDRLLPDGVLDTIAGHSPAFPPNNLHVPFNAMKPLNNISDVLPAPYAFDGVRAEEVEHIIRDREENFLLATKRYEVPVAPNFFLEVGGGGGGYKGGEKGGLSQSGSGRGTGTGVVVAAAGVDGACGARGMYVVKNYGGRDGCGRGEGRGGDRGEGEGLAFSGTYSEEEEGRGGRVLRLFVHHVQGEGGREGVDGLRYYMTELGRWEMTGGYEEFLRGARAFRNLRVWAGEVRLGVVEEGNSRVGKVGWLGGR